MEFKPKYLVDILGEAIGRVRYKMNEQNLLTGIDKPYFVYDTLPKFKERIAATEKSGALKFRKYPLIYLQLPFNENYDVDYPLLYEATCTIYILNRTKPQPDAERRYDDVFRPVLYPIFEHLINELEAQKDIYSGGKRKPLSYAKRDLMYWGEGEANVSTDIVDAIEISNLKLGIYHGKYCN